MNTKTTNIDRVVSQEIRDLHSRTDMLLEYVNTAIKLEHTYHDMYVEDGTTQGEPSPAMSERFKLVLEKIANAIREMIRRIKVFFKGAEVKQQEIKQLSEFDQLKLDFNKLPANRKNAAFITLYEPSASIWSLNEEIKAVVEKRALKRHAYEDTRMDRWFKTTEKLKERIAYFKRQIKFYMDNVGVNTYIITANAGYRNFQGEMGISTIKVTMANAMNKLNNESLDKWDAKLGIVINQYDKDVASTDYFATFMNDMYGNMDNAQQLASLMSAMSGLLTSTRQMIYMRNKVYIKMCQQLIKGAQFSALNGANNFDNSIKVDIKTPKAMNTFDDIFAREDFSLSPYKRAYTLYAESINDILMESDYNYVNESFDDLWTGAKDVVRKIIEQCITYIRQLYTKAKLFITDVRYKSYMTRIGKALSTDPELKNKKITVTNYDKVIAELDKCEKLAKERFQLALKIAIQNEALLKNEDKDPVRARKLKRELEQLQKGEGKYKTPKVHVKDGIIIGLTATTISVAAAYALIEKYGNDLTREYSAMTNDFALKEIYDGDFRGEGVRATENIISEYCNYMALRANCMASRIMELGKAILSAVTPGTEIDYYTANVAGTVKKESAEELDIFLATYMEEYNVKSDAELFEEAKEKLKEEAKPKEEVPVFNLSAKSVKKLEKVADVLNNFITTASVDPKGIYPNKANVVASTSYDITAHIKTFNGDCAKVFVELSKDVSELRRLIDKKDAEKIKASLEVLDKKMDFSSVKVEKTDKEVIGTGKEVLIYARRLIELVTAIKNIIEDVVDTTNAPYNIDELVAPLASMATKSMKLANLISIKKIKEVNGVAESTEEEGGEIADTPVPTNEGCVKESDTEIGDLPVEEPDDPVEPDTNAPEVEADYADPVEEDVDDFDPMRLLF